MTHTTNGFARKSFTIQSGSFCLFHQILELSRWICLPRAYPILLSNFTICTGKVWRHSTLWKLSKANKQKFFKYWRIPSNEWIFDGLILLHEPWTDRTWALQVQKISPFCCFCAGKDKTLDVILKKRMKWMLEQQWVGSSTHGMTDHLRHFPSWCKKAMRNPAKEKWKRISPEFFAAVKVYRKKEDCVGELHLIE